MDGPMIARPAPAGHLAAEELMRVFCLGDVPVVLRKADGSTVAGRMFGLRTDECVGFRGDAVIPPNWVVSLVSDQGARIDVGLDEIAAIEPR